jgi:peptidoglycan/xylan/chitin deacetylase (PgdA/CDA1 family)
VRGRPIAARRRLPPVVLTYHALGRVAAIRDHNSLFCPVPSLERHLWALERLGYKLVTFGQIAEAAGRKRAAGLASVTFDDGFRTTAEYLFEAGIPATVFVVPAWLGGRHPHAAWTEVMSAAQVRQLAARGVEIGAHTMTHRDLDQAGYDVALAEWTRSCEALERMTGAPVVVASYPFGRVTAEAAAACAAAGIRFAATTDARGNWDDPLRLPRLPTTARTSVAGLALRILNAHPADADSRSLALLSAVCREALRVRDARRAARVGVSPSRPIASWITLRKVSTERSQVNRPLASRAACDRRSRSW